jgi:hypothetical protein
MVSHVCKSSSFCLVKPSVHFFPGVLVFGGVITVALIIVGVMESSGSGGSLSSSPLQGIDQPLAGSSSHSVQHSPAPHRCCIFGDYYIVLVSVEMRSFSRVE